jgi:hypothetical protein
MAVDQESGMARPRRRDGDAPDERQAPEETIERKPEPKPESDPRFPSGEWKGFWLQRGWPGRQWMRLVLQFADGTLRGEGKDIVGAFRMSGRYDLKNGHCTIFKHYVGRHQVVYSGCNEGDGLWVWGTWKVAIDTGGFHLWPKGEKDPTGSTLSEEKELPADEERRILVGIGPADDGAFY